MRRAGTILHLHALRAPTYLARQLTASPFIFPHQVGGRRAGTILHLHALRAPTYLARQLTAHPRGECRIRWARAGSPPCVAHRFALPLACRLATARPRRAQARHCPGRIASLCPRRRLATARPSFGGLSHALRAPELRSVINNINNVQ